MVINSYALPPVTPNLLCQWCTKLEITLNESDLINPSTKFAKVSRALTWSSIDLREMFWRLCIPNIRFSLKNAALFQTVVTYREKSTIRLTACVGYKEYSGAPAVLLQSNSSPSPYRGVSITLEM